MIPWKGVRNRVRVRETCPWILGHSFGRNNRSSSQIAKDAVEPTVRVLKDQGKC